MAASASYSKEPPGTGTQTIEKGLGSYGVAALFLHANS